MPISKTELYTNFVTFDYVHKIQADLRNFTENQSKVFEKYMTNPVKNHLSVSSFKKLTGNLRSHSRPVAFKLSARDNLLG